MRRLLAGIVSVLLLVAFAGCSGGGVVVTGYGNIEGYVYQPEGTPTGTSAQLVVTRLATPPAGYSALPDAYVYLEEANDKEAYTDSNGRFIMTGVRAGTYTLAAFHEYFKVGSVTTVTVRANETAYPGSLKMGSGYYLLVGTDGGADQDINRILNTLVSTNTWFNGSIQIDILSGANATRAEIANKVSSITAEMTDSDYLVIYYSGPASKDTIQSGDGLPIKDSDLASWIVGSDLDITLVLETNYAASFADGETKAFQSRLYNLVFSTDRDELAELMPDGGGRFTYYFAEALKLPGDVDTNDNWLLEIDEIIDYVAPQVRLASGGDQNPTYYLGTPELGYIFEY